MLRNIYLVAFVTHIQSLLRFAGLQWCVGFAGQKLARRTGKRTMHRPLGKALGFLHCRQPFRWNCVMCSDATSFI